MVDLEPLPVCTELRRVDVTWYRKPTAPLNIQSGKLKHLNLYDRPQTNRPRTSKIAFLVKAHFLSSLRTLYVERFGMAGPTTATFVGETKFLGELSLRTTNVGLHAAQPGDIDLRNLDCLKRLYLDDEPYVSQLLLPMSGALEHMCASKCPRLQIRRFPASVQRVTLWSCPLPAITAFSGCVSLEYYGISLFPACDAIKYSVEESVWTDITPFVHLPTPQTLILNICLPDLDFLPLLACPVLKSVSGDGKSGPEVRRLLEARWQNSQG